MQIKNVRETEWAIKNGPFRHKGNIGHTRQGTKTKTTKTQHRKHERETYTRPHVGLHYEYVNKK